MFNMLGKQSQRSDSVKRPDSTETCEDLMWRDLRSNVARPISLSIPHFLLWALLVCLASDLHKL